MKGFQGLSVILPTVNETTSLKETVAAIFSSCDIADLHEIILATADFATPACRAVCKQIRDENVSSVPIRIYVQTGSFKNAISDLTAMLSGSHFIYQPTDLEEDPRLLADVIKLAKQYPDAIISGSRILSKRGFSVFSPVRRMMYQSWRLLFSALYGKGVTDSTLLYRCMPSAYAKKIKLTANSYAVSYELFLKLYRLGLPVVEFPVDMGKRVEGTSATRIISDGLRYLCVLFSVRFTSADNFLRRAEENAGGNVQA